jgi:hypothetical protein
MTAPAAPKKPPARRAEAGQIPRRMFVMSALVLFGALVIGIGAIAVFSDPGAPSKDANEQDATPHIITQPNSGTEPESSGDRGGTAQLLLMAGMCAAIVGIGVVAFRGGKGAKANRERWKAAGQTGTDGALDLAAAPTEPADTRPAEPQP